VYRDQSQISPEFITCVHFEWLSLSGIRRAWEEYGEIRFLCIIRGLRKIREIGIGWADSQVVLTRTQIKDAIFTLVVGLLFPA
jgi:hypothetical protein